MEALAAADALSSISGHRYQSHWQTMALEDHRPLLRMIPERHHHDDVVVYRTESGEEVIADYQSTGLTLRAHPLALLRQQHPLSQCQRKRNSKRWQSPLCASGRPSDLSPTTGHCFGSGISDA